MTGPLVIVLVAAAGVTGIGLYLESMIRNGRATRNAERRRRRQNEKRTDLRDKN